MSLNSVQKCDLKTTQHSIYGCTDIYLTTLLGFSTFSPPPIFSYYKQYWNNLVGISLCSSLICSFEWVLKGAFNSTDDSTSSFSCLLWYHTLLFLSDHVSASPADLLMVPVTFWLGLCFFLSFSLSKLTHSMT